MDSRNGCLVLSKRRPQGRDLLNRPYGRFFHIPQVLARKGYRVSVLLLSYEKEPAEYRHQHGIDWYSESLFPQFPKGGLFPYMARATALIRETRPQWVIGFSDTWFGILAQRLGSRHGIHSLIDAYDNYESYIPWARPLHWAWRSACRKATALTAAGPELLELLAQGRKDGCTVVPMAADPLFLPMDRNTCRTRLGLPNHTQLVGYCGSLHSNRGIDILFEVIRRFQALAPAVRFVISGRRQPGLEIPQDIKKGVIELGYLPDDDVPFLLNSLDAALVVNLPSAFGSYSYPVKLCEAMQCGIPVVSTAVSGAAWILREHPECLAASDDIPGLVDRVMTALASGRMNYRGLAGWEVSAAGFQAALENIRY